MSWNGHTPSCAYRKHLNVKCLNKFIAPFVTTAQAIDFEKNELNMVRTVSERSETMHCLSKCNCISEPTVLTALSLSSELLAPS
jgi:hypothetical protein